MHFGTSKCLTVLKMKSLIVYCSKTGNTDKVALRIAKGLGGDVELVRLDLSPEGVMKEFHPGFTWDASPFDLICLGGGSWP